jgi:glycosyltransferase involved in cell wall biosynthesis
MEIKFSVIIPLYNKEKEIKDAIESVLNQTYKADEIIVVDDGSTDKSAEIVEKYFKCKVKLIKQNNCGVSCARNRGIQESKNEYLCFLDADDLWENNFLEEIANLIKDFPDAIVYTTSHKIIDENGNILKSKVSLPKDFRGYIDNFIKIYNNNYGIINSSSFCVRKSANPVFPPEEKRGEDICLWIELSLKGRFAFLNKALSIYKLNASNRSINTHKNPIIPCQLKWIYKNKDRATKDIRKFVHKNIIITVYGLAANGDREFAKEVIKYMRQNNDYYWLFLVPALFLDRSLLNFIKQLRRRIKYLYE